MSISHSSEPLEEPDNNQQQKLDISKSTGESEEGLVSSTNPDEIQPEASVESPESQLPPEAQGEMHGGPLGCCLGSTVGLLLSPVIIIGVTILSRHTVENVLGGALNPYINILMVLLSIIALITCARLGWIIGKKIYREYDPPVIKERRRYKKRQPRPKRV